jgi:DNA-binding CsgD family transcriptional regulator
MTSCIVGREGELASLRRFLEQEPAGPAALVLEGEAGIGKSTLWLAVVESAHERGLRVLSSRPAESERDLTFAGLGDLFESALAEIVPALPTPRRQVLEAALLLSDATYAADARALAVAVRNSLEILAAAGPLVVAVDDVQWFDRSSMNAVSFAFRRLEEPVFLVVARRVGEGIDRSELELALPEDSVQVLPVGPLSVGALQRLVYERLGRALSRPTQLRIHEISGGNPFYALEVARALDQDLDPAQPLPVPENLEDLVSDRIAGLPPSTRDALAIAWASGNPTLDLLRSAHVDEAALEPALAAHVVEWQSGVIAFTHPLFGSVLNQRRSVPAQRATHRRLADVVDDPLEAARHLALATETPDPGIASALENAAAIAADRAAMATSVELHEHALRLTVPDDEEDRDRRTMAAAHAHAATGDIARARVLAQELCERAAPGAAHAEALELASDLAESQQEMIALRRAALREAVEDPALQARLHAWLAWVVRFQESLGVAEEHAQASLELAERLDDDGLHAQALAALSAVRFHLGRADALELGEKAYELAPAAEPRGLMDVTLNFTSTLIWSGHVERARFMLERLLEHWSERDENEAGAIVWRLIFVELAQGRLHEAEDYAERAREISILYGDRDVAPNVVAVAFVAAWRGQLDRGRELAQQGLERSKRDDPWFAAYFKGLLGSVALWSGDAQRAVEHFAAAEAARSRFGSAEPNLARWRADYVEALLELGRVEEAVAVLDPWEADAARLGRGVVLAQALRCRGLMAATRGDLNAAASLLEDAARLHDEVGDPLGRGRALLSLGVVRRRLKQKRAAREAITEAAGIFETCGAELWAERARAELGHVGGRMRESGLTPAEARVAALVVQGRTNREVAAVLVLGERTVEAHLTHIYAKLGVRSRTELARTLGSS